MKIYIYSLSHPIVLLLAKVRVLDLHQFYPILHQFAANSVDSISSNKRASAPPPPPTHTPHPAPPKKKIKTAFFFSSPESQGLPKQPPLKLAIAQATNCMKLMAKAGIGACAFASVSDYIH